MKYVIDIINSRRIPIRVVFLTTMDRSAVDTKGSLVEFFDRRFDFTSDGAFLGSCDTDILRDGHGAINFIGHVGIDVKSMDLIRQWVTRLDASTQQT